ncbi:hypothetical protein KI387_024257, partial [Taxus chinensis]
SLFVGILVLQCTIPSICEISNINIISHLLSTFDFLTTKNCPTFETLTPSLLKGAINAFCVNT